MKKYLVPICVFSVYFQANADQIFVSGGDYSATSSFDDFDVHVENGATVSLPGNDINMNLSVHLYNDGYINGTINTNGHVLNVYNSGTIAGGINASGGTVIQHVRSGTELTNISVTGGGFSVEIDGYQNANFTDIKNMNADSFTITGSSVVIDDFNDWQNWDKNVVLNGEILLIINNPESVHSGEVIRHTVNGNTINVVIPNLDKMYKPELILVGDELVLNIVRETNYDLVFSESSGNNSETGSVLEALRNKHNQDKLLSALDSANTWDEINKIKNLSYRFNHDILLRPIKTLNSFSLVDSLKSETETGFGIIPYYTISNKMDGFGGRVYVGYENEFIYVNAGIGMHKFDYSDKFNEFSGISYAFDIKSKQHINKFFLGEIIGLNLTDFKADYVSKDNKLENNPLGISWYGDIFIGYDFDLFQDIKITPNVGFAYQRYDVADVLDNESFVHGGMEIKYSFTMDGIKYEYALSGGGGSDSNLYLTTSVGFISVLDMAGASAEIGILNDEIGTHYKFSLNAKVLL